MKFRHADAEWEKLLKVIGNIEDFFPASRGTPVLAIVGSGNVIATPLGSEGSNLPGARYATCLL